MRTSWLVTAAIALALIASCSSESSISEPSLVQGKVSLTIAPADITVVGLESEVPATVPDLSAIHEPYELISLTGPEQVVAFTASERLISKCMVQRGFDYTPLPAPDFDAIHSSQQPITREQIGQFGFISQRANFSKPSAAEEVLGRTFEENEAFATAYFGANADGSDGCYVPARSAVFGTDDTLNFEILQQMVENKVAEFRKAATSTAEYLAKEDLWSSCMSKAGYAFASLSALRGIAWPAPRPGESEIATALQDFDCRTTAGLDDYIARSVSNLQQAWQDEDPGLLEALRRARTQLYARCMEILKSP